ncbi:MAG TPA: hypothetical protein VHX61_10800 [Rhizomicrobium sp.]|jgi:hypothetical protein|nr:hypothetical protein [Rhizomicrobium sp.]
MGTASQLLTRFGPPLLVVIGVALCLAYPMVRRGRWAFLAAFLILGVPVSVASFLVTRPGGVSTAPVTAHAARFRSAEKSVGGGSNAPERRVVTRVAGAEVITGGERQARPNPSRQARPVYETVRQSHQRVRPTHQGVRSNRSGTRAVVLVIPPQAHANALSANSTTRTNSKIPPNTLSCTGFTRDPEGAWEAGDNTQPFNVGSETNYTVRDEGPIRPGWLSIGTVDLYALLDAKCGGSSKPRH